MKCTVLSVGRIGPLRCQRSHVILGKHIYIYTRVRTLLSQAPHTNESILCHEPSPGTIVVTYPSCTVYPTDPERSRTPTAELHHSRTMMPCHTIGNLRYETTDLRRPVSITAVTQRAHLLGSRYDRSRTTITNARYNGKSQFHRKIPGNCPGKAAIPNSIIYHC